MSEVGTKGVEDWPAHQAGFSIGSFPGCKLLADAFIALLSCEIGLAVNLPFCQPFGWFVQGGIDFPGEEVKAQLGQAAAGRGDGISSCMADAKSFHCSARCFSLPTLTKRGLRRKYQ